MQVSYGEDANLVGSDLIDDAIWESGHKAPAGIVGEGSPGFRKGPNSHDGRIDFRGQLRPRPARHFS
jgi:hypothetical protein